MLRVCSKVSIFLSFSQAFIYSLYASPFSAVNLNSIEKSGSWFSYNGEKVGQGRENVKVYLTEHPDMMDEVEKKIRDNFNKAFENALVEENDEDEDFEDEE